MAEKLQPVRGTHDLLPEDAQRFRFIIETALGIAARYGYGEIATPMFEFSEVFHRTLGHTSDVVTKETYTFEDRGGEKLTLRPEFTAGVARAFISNALQDQLPLKFFYAGPAFRYERPQKGRQRQFHQIGCELLGVDSPLGDVETIALAYQVLGALGLKDKVKLEINTLGDFTSRGIYRDALKKYFSAHESQLSEDSKMRLARNPLRILDSKDEGDRQLFPEAPKMKDLMTTSAKKYFEDVTYGLTELGIAWEQNESIVRGLDYYSHTVFEFTTDMLGAQGTVLAGGRYDGLVELMGGQPTAGIGWAAGIERLAALADFSTLAAPRPVAVIPLGDAGEREGFKLAQGLRGEGFHVELAYKGNLGNRMKKANRARACAAIIIGDSEIAKGIVVLKDLDSGAQQEISGDALASALAPYRDRH